MRADIVILGGGFAGVYAAKALFGALDRAARKRLSVAIVAQENHMVFQPMLPEVAGATLSPRHVVNPIRSLCRHAEVYKARTTRVDHPNRRLFAEAGSFVGEFELAYEQLAVCLGAQIDLSRIPGMQEHALQLQNVGDAMRLRATIISRFEEANLARDEKLKRRLLSFVVVGGGYSGVETAGQLLDLSTAIHRYYKNVDLDDCRVTLIHSQDHLLPTLHRSLGDYTAENLQKRGLVLKMRRRAKAVTANVVYLDDGETIETNTVVSTIGNAPHPLVLDLAKASGLETERGRLKASPECRVEGVEDLWTAGDCAAIPLPNGKIAPPTAQFAMRQGRRLGKNLAAALAGKPPSPFAFTGLGELASIGHHAAVGQIKGLRFSGFFAWWLWRTIYLSKLPGIERKLRVMFEWTLELFFPHDINLLNPRYTAELAESYLEPGDVLFRAGDPAFSFYIVKSGSIELRDSGEPIKTIGAGEHFGERALLENRIYKFDAVAREPTSLVAIGVEVFSKILEADAAFASSLRQSARSLLSRDQLDGLLQRLPKERLDRPIADLMTRETVHFRAESPVTEAMAQLGRHPRNAFPVIDAERRPIGVLRKETLYLSYQTGAYDADSRVDSLPLAKLPALEKGRTVREAMKTMTRAGATKTLAVDEKGRLAGILALIDILEH